MRCIALFALGLTACAPDQPAATVRCDALSDCALDQVCERASARCIPEPENRFLGKFECTVSAPKQPSAGLDLSEVIGRIGGDRWALPGAVCVLGGTTLMLGFTDLLAGNRLTFFVSAKDAAGGHVDVQPFVDEATNAAMMENSSTFTAFGYSGSGAIELSSAPAVGQPLSGYVDVTMIPTAQGDALFGAPCPNGLADCGKKTVDVGGVAICTNVKSGPMCTTAGCTGNGDCALGNGVCVAGFCTKRCAKDSDCVAPLKCFSGDPGEGSGCF